MKKSDIDAWSYYLVAQIREQYGLSQQEAQRTVQAWLRKARHVSIPRVKPRPAMARAAGHAR